MPVVAVSLKAYFGAQQTLDWCAAVADVVRARPATGVDVLVLPSFPLLGDAIRVFEGTGVQVGAQDVHWSDGPWTGAVSAPLLAELGCTSVEVGHAERRALGDTDDVVALKTAAAVSAGLAPLVCVGEREHRDAASAADECVRQLASSLAPAPSATGLLIAYEPVWAIGASEPAPAEHVSAVCRRLAAEVVGTGRVLYGGSAGPGLLDRLDAAVEGLFLGRFAHDVARFAAVLDETTARYERTSP